MRLKYYARLFRQMHFKKAFAIICIFAAISIMLYTYFANQVGPMITTLCDSRAKAIALMATNQSIRENMANESYGNLVEVLKDSNGKINGINTNVVEMNKLSTKIATSIQKNLLESEDIKITVPIGKLLGWSAFSGYGPKINIKAIPTGNVNVDFKTEFTSGGINQTKHRIILIVNTGVRMVAPFISDLVTVETKIVIAETVIIGDTPTTYYNLEGIEGLEKQDTTNFMND